MNNQINDKKIKGIKIRKLNIYMFCFSMVLWLLFIFFAVQVYSRYSSLKSSIYTYVYFEELSSQIRSSSDYLTEQARLYTVHKNVKYLEAYLLKIRNIMSKDNEIRKAFIRDKKMQNSVSSQKVLNSTQDLIKIEIRALQLISLAEGLDFSLLPKEIYLYPIQESDTKLSRLEQEKIGIDIVFNNEYVDKKHKVYNDLDDLISQQMFVVEKNMFINSQELKKSIDLQYIMLIAIIISIIFLAFMVHLLLVRPIITLIDNVKNEKPMDLVGSYEMKFLSSSYNYIHEINTKRQEELKYDAEHDLLAGVYNRGAFEKIIYQLRDKPVNLALLIIDIDNFKNINDSYGHEIGDAIIKKVSNALRNLMRLEDKVIRFGGDEFVVIILDVTPANKRVIEEKLKQINEQLINPVDNLPAVSISSGGAFSETGYNDKLFKNADEALHISKRKGKMCSNFQDNCLMNNNSYQK